MKTLASGLMLATLVMADLPAVTITAAPQSVQSALVSYISDYNHHTLGVNMTVGAAISSVYMASAAYPTAADAILGVRSLINYEDGPTPLFKALENPSSVISSIAAQLPTVAPFPGALAVVSDLYAYLGSIASSELNHETTLAPPPPGWTPNMEEPEGVAAVTSTSAAVVATAAASATPQQQVENGAESHTLPGSFTSVALAVLFCAGVMVL